MNKDKAGPIALDSEFARIFGNDARSFYLANEMTLRGLMPQRVVPLTDAELAAKVAELEPTDD